MRINPVFFFDQPGHYVHSPVLACAAIRACIHLHSMLGVGENTVSFLTIYAFFPIAIAERMAEAMI
jgi:hypothetical protein